MGMDAWGQVLASSFTLTANIVADDSLCARASAALDSIFILATVRDSLYLFTVGSFFAAAKLPPRAGMSVTVVRLDSAFVERSRRSVTIP
jgi:hypothetical protein